MKSPSAAFEVALSQAFPELCVHSVEVLGSGWDSTAFLVNKETVFRLPNEALAEKDLEELKQQNRAEVGLLHELRGTLPVAIPVPEYVTPDFSFFGYRYLAGGNLEEREDLFAAPDFRDRFVTNWVAVVTEITRAVPAARARDLGLKPFADVERRLGLVSQARVSGALSSGVERVARRVLDEYASRYRQAESRSVTLHGDLGAGHWLVNEEGDPYAIIDWSDACLAPVEHELANLYWTDRWGAELVETAAGGCRARTGAEVDPLLVDLDYAANALSDIGLMVEGDSPSPHIAKVVKHLESLQANLFQCYELTS